MTFLPCCPDSIENRFFLREMISSYIALIELEKSAPEMMFCACVGIGLSGRKGCRFALITKSIAEVLAELIDNALSVGMDSAADPYCLLCAA